MWVLMMGIGIRFSLGVSLFFNLVETPEWSFASSRDSAEGPFTPQSRDSGAAPLLLRGLARQDQVEPLMPVATLRFNTKQMCTNVNNVLDCASHTLASRLGN